jgi:hypothetical protein
MPRVGRGFIVKLLLLAPTLAAVAAAVLAALVVLAALQ